METYLIQITDYLLRQSWQIAVLVLVVAAATFVLRNKSAHVRYLLWLIVLAKCLVPPLLEVPVAVLPERQPVAAVFTIPMPAAVETMPETTMPPEVAPIVQTVAPSRPQLSTRQWGAIGWLAGVLALACIAAVKAWRTVRWLHRDRRPLPAEVQADVNALLSSLDLRRLPKMWLIEGIGQPFVWGTLRGDVYLPAAFVRIADDEHRRHVLGHELSHVMRFDAAVNLVQTIAQAVLWFHPFVWWANKKIRAEREKCCDEMAIARLNARAKDYSRAIVETLVTEYESTRRVPSLAIAGPVKNIEERIKIMLKPGKKFYRRPSLVAAIAVMLIALLTVPTALVLTARAAEETETKSEARPTKSLHKAAADGDLEQVKLHISNGIDVNARDVKGQTGLHHAVENGRREVAELLIASGADVNAGGYGDGTPLLTAIFGDDVDLVRLLVDKGADCNVYDQRGQTPLIYAVTAMGEKDKEIVELLISGGAKIDLEDKKGGRTPLHCAAFGGSERVFEVFLANVTDSGTIHLAALKGDLARVKAFVQSGIDVNAKDKCGCTPLHWAAPSNTNDVAGFLIAKGADVNAKDNNGSTPLLCARRLDMIRVLVSKGADVNAKGALGYTKLNGACLSDDRDMAAFLISKGADVNTKNNWGITPLLGASMNGNSELVELLVADGADVNMKYWNGTPLMAAAAGGHAKVVTFLIAKGANIGASDNKGRTAISLAKENGHAEVIDILRQHGAREDSRSEKGSREPTKSLHQAAAEGDLEQVKLHISNGADVNAKDQRGRAALHRAAYAGHVEVMRLLIEHGADVNAKDKLKRTPLEHAAVASRTKVVKLLIEEGANPNARNEGGATPLHVAARSADRDTVKLLIDKGADVTLSDDGGSTPLHAVMMSSYPGRRDILDLIVATSKVPSTIHLAAYMGDLPKVKTFIEKGVAVNEKQADGSTALHCAAAGGQKEVAQLLLARGADLNAQATDGSTPLHTAVFCSDDAETVKLLIANGADVNAHASVEDETGMSVLGLRLVRCLMQSMELADAGGEKLNARVKSLWNSDVTVVLISNGARFGDGDKMWLSIAEKRDIPDIMKLAPTRNDDENEKQPDHSATLQKAAVEGDVEQVKKVLAAGAAINAKDSDGNTPLNLAVKAAATAALFRAIRYANVEKMRLAIDQGADLEGKNKDTIFLIDNVQSIGCTPLYIAAGVPKGNDDMIGLLLEAGANPNTRGPDGQIPLHAAARSWHISVVELLVSGGSDVNAADKEGRTPAIIAFELGHADMFDLMVAHGATVSTDLMSAYKGDLSRVKSLIANGKAQEKLEQDLTLLHAAAVGGQTAIVDLLLANGLNVRSKTQAGYTALHYAVAGNHREVAELLLAKGADVNTEPGRQTPLHWAIREQHKDMIDWLLARGANPNADGGSWWATPLHWAVWWEDIETAVILVSHGGDIHLVTQTFPYSPLLDSVLKGQRAMVEALVAKTGDTRAAKWAPLHATVVSGDIQAIEDLLAQGADVNAKGEQGWSALHLAAVFGHKDIAELLIEKGADVNAKSGATLRDEDITALHGACRHGQKGVAELLIAKGADVNAKSKNGYTPLHVAVREGYRDVAELLIANGADINAKDDKGQAASSLAREHGWDEIIELLRKHGATE